MLLCISRNENQPKKFIVVSLIYIVRDPDRHQEAIFHLCEGDAKERNHTYNEIKLVNFEQVIYLLVLDQPNHGCCNDGREDDQGSVLEQRSQEQQNQHHDHCLHHVRHLGLAS